MHNKLKEYRNKFNYTSKEMTKKLNISRAYYTQIENNTRRLSYELAIKVANVFGVLPDEIFYDDYEDK